MSSCQSCHFWDAERDPQAYGWIEEVRRGVLRYGQVMLRIKPGVYMHAWSPRDCFRKKAGGPRGGGKSTCHYGCIVPPGKVELPLRPASEPKPTKARHEYGHERGDALWQGQSKPLIQPFLLFGGTFNEQVTEERKWKVAQGRVLLRYN
jgi:hypothetical protein